MSNILKKGSFKIDVYGAIIYMILCKDAESMLVEVNKTVRKFKEEEMFYPAEGVTFAPNARGGTYYIWLCPEYLSVNTITHETDHLRNYIMAFYGINENNDSKEASANLNGYINQKVFKFLSTHSQIKY
jgi:hypothetical protein